MSESAPPHSPRPSGPRPYAEPRFTSRQLPVSPAMQRSHAPHDTWNGTITVSPGRTLATASPTSMTSAMNSWPSAKGPGTGNRPLMIRRSRSQLATTTGRTSASPAPWRTGSGTSRHSTTRGSTKVSWRIGGLCDSGSAAVRTLRRGRGRRRAPGPGGSTRSRPRRLVHSVVAHEVVDRVIGVDRLTGVAPEALEHVVLHQAAIDVPVVDVGDLELVAVRRLQHGEHIPHRLVVAVDAGDGEIARWLLGFLDDAHDASGPVHLGDAEVLEVLGLLDRGQ